jgi:cell division septation protein DedD
MTQGNREVILERKQAVMLFAGGVIALVLVFVLGVLFGRNMAERKGAKEQSQASQTALATEPVKPVPAGTAAAPPSLVAGETALKQKIDQQKVPPLKTEKGATAGQAAKTPAPATMPPETAKTGTAAPPKTAETKTQPATAKPAETKPAETKPKETAPPAPAKSGPSIQVASFPDKPSADELVKKLKADKWPAFEESTKIQGKGTYYRVCLGPYASREQANKALVIFKAKEPKYKDAFVRK